MTEFAKGFDEGLVAALKIFWGIAMVSVVIGIPLLIVELKEFLSFVRKTGR